MSGNKPNNKQFNNSVMIVSLPSLIGSKSGSMVEAFVGQDCDY
jgi:hypothetical protein